MTTTQYPRPRVQPTKKRKHTVRNILLGFVLLFIAIGIAAALGASGSKRATPTASAADVPTPKGSEPVAPPTHDDPLSDGGWKASDIQVDRSQFGTAFTARVTNMEAQTRTGLFTLTVFLDGQRIYQTSGAANSVEPEQTATVTFVGTTEQLPGDSASYAFELQSDLT